MRKSQKAMPLDHSLPESRDEANTARQTNTSQIIGTVLDIPERLAGKNAKWFIIFLSMLVFFMGAGALFYQQKQMSEMRAEAISIREESNLLRKQLTDYLVVANVSTTSALDRNTAALAENSRIMHRMEAMLDVLAAKLKN